MNMLLKINQILGQSSTSSSRDARADGRYLFAPPVGTVAVARSDAVSTMPRKSSDSPRSIVVRPVLLSNLLI